MQHMVAITTWVVVREGKTGTIELKLEERSPGHLGQGIANFMEHENHLGAQIARLPPR